MNYPSQPLLPAVRDLQRLLRRTPVRHWGRPPAGADPRFWAGVGFGMAVGGALGTLLNPRSGPETRQRLRERYQRVREQVQLSDSPSNIEESIVLEVPVTQAYNQWTQFEEFPRFMQGIQSVHQIDNRHLHWKAEFAGQAQEWDAEITEQLPDRRIAWRSTSGPIRGGVVTFHRLTDETCKVMLQMDYQPEGALERLGDTLGVVRRRVRGDLERFQDFIEERAEPTGAFREEIG